MMIYELILVSVLVGLNVAANDRPIIGVLAQETDEEMRHYGDSYFYSDYVKLVELAGARAVPIKIDKPDEYYTQMFKNINGVVFPGGGVDILTSGYAKAAQKLYKLAIQENDAGGHFPMLGICLGFQLLTSLTSGKNVLTDCHAENMTLNLLKYDDFSFSKIFGGMTADMAFMVTEWNVTSNFHQECLTPQSFESNTDLKEFYNALSHNYDKNGLDYISTIEGKRYPFYGTQWHPEKNIFHYDRTANVNHSLGAIQVTQYIANFFVNEARKSRHAFYSIDDEVGSLIDNYKAVFLGIPSLRDVFYFNVTEEEEESYIDEGFDWIGFHVTERCKRGLKIMLMMFVMVVVTVTMGVFLRRWLQVNNQNMSYQHVLSLSQRYAMLDHGMDDSRLPKAFPLHDYSYNNAPEKVSIAVPD